MIPQIFIRTGGPITTMTHEAGRNPKIVLVGCVFVEIVTESETCHIYKAVLLTIKVAVCNASGHKNTKAIHNIIQQNWT
jgi:hypothetical protein